MPSISKLHFQVVKGQSLLDLAVIEGGGVEALFDLAERNGLDTLHPVLEGGEVMLLPAQVDPAVVATLKNEGKRVATGEGIDELVNPETCDDGIGCWQVGVFEIPDSELNPDTEE